MSTAKLLRWLQEHTVYLGLNSSTLQPRADHVPPFSEKSQNTHTDSFACETRKDERDHDHYRSNISCRDILYVIILNSKLYVTCSRWSKVNLTGSWRWLVFVLLTATVTTLELSLKVWFACRFIPLKKTSAEPFRFA